MYKRGTFQNRVGYFTFNREEFEKNITGVLWNEENAKRVILEKLGINASYIKVDNDEQLFLHYISHYDRIIVRMQTNQVPCECLRTPRFVDEDEKKSEVNEISVNQDSDYAENGINIENLPPSLLETILSYVPDKMNLRLVSKTFQNIIDYSSKLLKDQWLIMENVLDVDPRTINYAYQKLKIHLMGEKEMNWISEYQRKNRVKAIKFTSGERCPIFMQYVISNFDSLELIDLDLDRFYDEKFHMRDDMRLVPNERSKLEILHVGYYQNEQCNILEMFANIPTIKTLYIYDFDLLIFPKHVKWNLEKLAIPDRPTEDFGELFFIEIEEDNFKEFLISQQKSLKELRFHDYLNFYDFIIKNLPNLECLTLSMEKEVVHSFNTEFLISDFNLKSLTFNYINTELFPILKDFLKHYKCVKYLCISSHTCSLERHPWLSTGEIHFENLTHLLLKSAWSFVILKSKLPKLRFLGLVRAYDSEFEEEDEYKTANIPNESVKNVEKASLKVCKLDDVLVVVRKCPKLSHLNVDIREWCEKSISFISQINEIIAAAPQIRRLGLCEWYLNKQNVTQTEVMDQIVNKNVILKVHDEFPSMLDEDWDQEFSDYMDYWYFFNDKIDMSFV